MYDRRCAPQTRRARCGQRDADARLSRRAGRDEQDVTQAAQPAPLLTIERQVIGRRMVLAVTGEVDVDSTLQLRSAIDSALEGGAQELWIDLSATSFLDSSGIHLLVAADRRASELRRRFAVICPPGCVRRVLDLIGVASALPLYADRGAAHRDG